MSDDIRLEAAWTPELLKEVSRLNLTGPGNRQGRRHRRTVWLIVGAIAAVLVLLFGPVRGIVPAQMLWFVLGLLVMRAVTTFVHLPALNRRRIAARLSSPLSQGPLSITVSGKGIIAEQAVSYTAYDWNAVTQVQEGPLALHLMMGEALSVPIPYDALPDGVDPENLQQRVEGWRAGAAAR